MWLCFQITPRSCRISTARNRRRHLRCYLFLRCCWVCLHPLLHGTWRARCQRWKLTLTIAVERGINRRSLRLARPASVFVHKTDCCTWLRLISMAMWTISHESESNWFRTKELRTSHLLWCTKTMFLVYCRILASTSRSTDVVRVIGAGLLGFSTLND